MTKVHAGSFGRWVEQSVGYRYPDWQMRYKTTVKRYDRAVSRPPVAFTVFGGLEILLRSLLTNVAVVSPFLVPMGARFKLSSTMIGWALRPEGRFPFTLERMRTA